MNPTSMAQNPHQPSGDRSPRSRWRRPSIARTPEPALAPALAPALDAYQPATPKHSVLILVEIFLSQIVAVILGALVVAVIIQ